VEVGRAGFCGGPLRVGMPRGSAVPVDRGHCPYERRVDGDRITEVIPAREWLSRQDKNALKPDDRGQYPPSLPRYSTRDHLHDRNRELSMFDPANPGQMTYVRVTRRRHPDASTEAALHHMRKDLVLQQQVIEEMQSESANELLQLRSQGIRTLLAARSRGWDRPASASAAAAAAATEKARAARVSDLEQQLKRMRATYEYKGYSQQAQPPATAPAPVGRPRLRGGWPVDRERFDA